MMFYAECPEFRPCAELEFPRLGIIEDVLTYCVAKVVI